MEILKGQIVSSCQKHDLCFELKTLSLEDMICASNCRLFRSKTWSVLRVQGFFVRNDALCFELKTFSFEIMRIHENTWTCYLFFAAGAALPTILWTNIQNNAKYENSWTIMKNDIYSLPQAPLYQKVNEKNKENYDNMRIHEKSARQPASPASQPSPAQPAQPAQPASQPKIGEGAAGGGGGGY